MNRRAQALLTIIIVLLILTFYRDDYMSSQHPIPDTITETSTGQKYKLPTPVSNKWIVVTSINYPSKDVKRLASLKGWNLVVVADRKTPPDWHYDNVHFLSMDYQQKLHFRLSVVSPENSYTRKNIGYLYAIKNGAEWIYDTDDDNKPYGEFRDSYSLTQEPTASAEKIPERFGVTPIADKLRETRLGCHNGHVLRSNENTICNQGLNLQGNEEPGKRSKVRPKQRHKLFNPYRFFGNPGMWPRGFPLEHLKTFRLLYADKETGLNERFNEFTPPIVLNSGTYSPWNSQNTLFHRNAFFTLFLPVSVAFRDVYLKSGKFVDFLEEWQCYSNDIANCTVELAEQLGYKFPAMVAQKSDDNCWDSTGNKEVNCFPAHIELETDMPLRRSARALQRMKQKLEYAEDLHDWCRKAQPAESSMNTTNPLNFITLNEKVHHQTMIPECLVKVQQMKLQNVTGYYAMSESITLQMWIWHDPLKVVFPSMNVKPHQKLWTENNGTPPGEPVYKLITEKYKNDEDVQKMWKEYQRGLSANGDSRSAAEHIRSDTGHADASFIYIPSSKIDYFSQIIRIFYEANLPEGFAVAKFLDTVRVEWISVPPTSYQRLRRLRPTPAGPAANSAVRGHTQPYSSFNEYR
ncbi:hypothetical protein ANCCEY_14291 [Ancylostoma ceylanicum]|uniref:Uncharacterized protein n=1 Tax=Ancylostoma ceylanicum TaxID=53326 RepID=A0A0D6LG27_9BILA|nr:hypothetical protein ANCCEY_14291 [Ancylostoma ceylanicum]